VLDVLETLAIGVDWLARTIEHWSGATTADGTSCRAEERR
jgi:hypothetical protein